MNIGVDASSLCGSLTGFGVYLRGFLGHMAPLDRESTFYLYAARPLGVKFDQPNVIVRTDNSRLPRTFWLQIHGQRVALRDRLDCFWGPGHFLPPGLESRVRTVVTVHDLVYPLYPQYMTRYFAFLHRCFFARSVRQADAVITVSRQTRQDLIEHLHIDPAKVSAVHRGVDPEFHPLAPETVRARLEALGIRNEYLLAVGTLEPRKNYLLLFRAMATLPSCPPLLIAGGRGWKFGKALRELRELGLGSRVSLLDYVSLDDLVALYNRALLLVQTSLYEGFGLPVLQAMACGVPVLASNTSSLPEVGGEAAAYFESNSIESLRAGLVRLLAEPETRAAMAQKGLQRAKEFSWTQAAQETLNILKGTA